MSQDRSDDAAQALMHHKIVGRGAPPIVFVHGFACSHVDWQAQVAHFSPAHTTVALDLPSHGVSKAPAERCNVALYGKDVAALVGALALPPAVLVGHSMGCRVVLEAAQHVPDRVAAIVLVDGSQFAPAMLPAIEGRLAAGEYRPLVRGMFEQMFTRRSAPATVAAGLDRALALPEDVGKAALVSLVRYDLERLDTVLGFTTKPLLVLQTTFTNARRERETLKSGQTTPFLDFVRTKVPAARVEIIPDTGHFPQLDAPEETNRILASFVAAVA
jgi:pimeloyl-ACP methyl ester carboxylesterase